jgi:solute carrier family 30 (zinc transporter), member 9
VPATATARAAEAQKGETNAVNIAIVSNVVIFLAKLYVSQASGSSSLASEAVHTLADIGNQLLLRLGIARSTKAPTSEYPYGYLKEKFVFSLISAVGVFCIGAGASLINGAHALMDTDHDVGSFGLNFFVLAVSFVVEGFSCAVAVRTIQAGADRRGVTFFEHLDSAADPAAVAVMAEDGAAVAGVTIAAAATALVRFTDWQAWDGLGSVLVGVLLAAVALFLIQRNRSVLIGRAMHPDEFARVYDYLLADPVVHHVYEARSEEIGPGVYRFSADLDFHGDVIVQKYLARVDAAALQAKFLRTANADDPSDTRAFEIVLKEHGARIVQAVGAEVDRMEDEIQRMVPEVKYVDLEADRGRFWLYRASVDADAPRARFDMSQLSLDAIAWARESDRIDFLLAEGRASSGQDGGGALPGIADRRMAEHASDSGGCGSSSSGGDEEMSMQMAAGAGGRAAGMVMDLWDGAVRAVEGQTSSSSDGDGSNGGSEVGRAADAQSESRDDGDAPAKSDELADLRRRVEMHKQAAEKLGRRR